MKTALMVVILLGFGVYLLHGGFLVSGGWCVAAAIIAVLLGKW